MRVCVVLTLTLIALAGCSSGPPAAPAIGEAYAGPASLNLRQDISPRSAVVATVPHGERLEIVQQRRRFYKVRTSKGAEGWTDERLLLSAAEISELRRAAEVSKSSPSQGAATTFDLLNIHTQPNRMSPSFVQVKEKETVEVIARRVTVREETEPHRLFVQTPRAARPEKRSKREKKRGKSEIAPPLRPAPPPLPPDWLALSRSTTARPATPAPSATAPSPAPLDDWTMVRTSSGQVGWVLTRRLQMAVPDEVAQYAEGRRISSYFVLGQTRDKDVTKNIWLWTTVEQGLQPHDFDSIRVFTWSTRRHRYETAYIERNLRGFLPVVLEQVDVPKQLRGRTDAAKLPGFTITIQKKDGKRHRRSYALWDTRVRLSGEAPVGGPAPPERQPNPPLVAGVQPQSQPSGSLIDRLTQWGKRVLGR
jgi:SH3-like domain-containing protein